MSGVRFSKDDFCNTIFCFFFFVSVCLFFLFFSSTTFPKQISFINFKREPFPYVQALYSVIMNRGVARIFSDGRTFFETQ